MAEVVIFMCLLITMGLGALIQSIIDYVDSVKMARLRSHMEFVKKHPHLYKDK